MCLSVYISVCSMNFPIEIYFFVAVILSEAEYIFSLATTVEVQWGDWTAWSECTVNCGGGRRTRRRSCEGGNTCVGRQTEYTDCNTNSCPEGNSSLMAIGSHTSIYQSYIAFHVNHFQLSSQGRHGLIGVAGVSALRHVREGPDSGEDSARMATTVQAQMLWSSTAIQTHSVMGVKLLNVK